jgi:hypothetical protein
MTIFWARRVGNSLHPDGDESIAAFSKLPFGKTVRVEVKQPRNGGFHKLYWALCARIAEGLGRDDIDAEKISDTFKRATGHYDILKTKSYGDIIIPRSISWAKCDQTEFSTFFEKCVRVAYTEWQIPPESVSDLLAPTEAR